MIMIDTNLMIPIIIGMIVRQEEIIKLYLKIRYDWHDLEIQYISW